MDWGRRKWGLWRERPIRFSKPYRSVNCSIIHLVETMLQLQKEKQQTNLPDKLNQLEARIKYTDDKINQLVFELYGLSEEEVGIVEDKRPIRF